MTHTDHEAIRGSGSAARQPLAQRLAAGVRRSGQFAAGVLAALAAVFLYGLLSAKPHLLTAGEVSTTVAESLASATAPPALSERVYAAIQPSVVLIQTRSADGQSLGSGVVVGDRGQILTSLHVVDKALDIVVTFWDGMRTPAHVITAQAENDIAVLQPESLPAQVVPAVLGNPAATRVGDEAFVVGNPLGLRSSMSAGVISGFDRSFQPQNSEQMLRGLIQIDAAVNPGNSGGPLLNRYGEVIGIVTGIANPTSQDVFIGIGFAVPITIAMGAMGAPPY